MPGSALATITSDLLDAAVDILSQPAPDRQYVSQGEPPFDCAQITTHLTRLQPRLLTSASQCAIIWTATLTIVLVRCALTADDNGNPPSAAALSEQDLALLVDAWDLAGLAREWVPPGGDCKSVTWLPLEPFTPSVQGGLTGWRIATVVEMTGMEDVGGS